jgi:hypothetical protein
LVIGVFKPELWLEATTENFLGRETREGRWGFVGQEAPEEMQKQYLRKRLPDFMRKKGAANPVKYKL